jgi:hypothetical protein
MRRLEHESHLFEKGRGIFYILERAPRGRPVANRALR